MCCISTETFINEAYSRGLPRGFYDKNTIERIEILLKIGVLNQELKLCDAFRKVLAEVAKGGDIEQFSEVDIKSIVDRHREWYRPND
jgi:hypothetical protein